MSEKAKAALTALAIWAALVLGMIALAGGCTQHYPAGYDEDPSMCRLPVGDC